MRNVLFTLMVVLVAFGLCHTASAGDFRRLQSAGTDGCQQQSLGAAACGVGGCQQPVLNASQYRQQFQQLQQYQLQAQACNQQLLGAPLYAPMYGAPVLQGLAAPLYSAPVYGGLGVDLFGRSLNFHLGRTFRGHRGHH